MDTEAGNITAEADTCSKTRYELKTVKELLNTETKEESEELTDEDFYKYLTYVDGIALKIKKSDMPTAERILLIDGLFRKAKRNVLLAGKQIYRPSKKDIKKVLGLYSSLVDNLNTSVPDIRYGSYSIVDFDCIDPTSAIQREGTIVILPLYFLVDGVKERLTIYEEVGHHALSSSPFSIAAEVWSRMDENYEYYMSSSKDERLSQKSRDELRWLGRYTKRSIQTMENGQPTRALFDGAPLFLSEKAAEGDEELKRGFERHLDVLGQAPDSDFYSKFKLIGYRAIKRVEETNPGYIRRLSSLKGDTELFSLAGIDVKDLGDFSIFYKV